MSSFVGGRGLELTGVESLEIRASEFVRGTPAIQCRGFCAAYRRQPLCRQNAVAIRVEGPRMPPAIRGNTFAIEFARRLRT